ncbi:hypothetical protein ACLB2K_063889 [Fragaria x ananassa]
MTICHVSIVFTKLPFRGFGGNGGGAGDRGGFHGGYGDGGGFPGGHGVRSVHGRFWQGQGHGIGGGIEKDGRGHGVD